MPIRPYRYSAALGAWLLVVIVLGAWFAHFFYNGGKALADVTRTKSIITPLNWLAGLCRHGEFADFHVFSMVLVAVLAVFPLMTWLLHKPDGPLLSELVAMRKDRPGLRQAFQAIPLCLAFSLSISAVSHGWPTIVVPERWLAWVLGACLAGLLMELIFRGVFLRLLSISLRMRNAIILSTVLYLLFFNALLPHGIHTWEPVLSSGRFPFFHSLVYGLFDPVHLLSQTLPLVLAGISLGWARARAQSCWLAVGVQIGILLAWRITPQSLPPLLAAVLTVYVFCGRPSLRTLEKS